MELTVEDIIGKLLQGHSEGHSSEYMLAQLGIPCNKEYAREIKRDFRVRSSIRLRDAHKIWQRNRNFYEGFVDFLLKTKREDLLSVRFRYGDNEYPLVALDQAAV